MNSKPTNPSFWSRMAIIFMIRALAKVKKPNHGVTVSIVKRKKRDSNANDHEGWRSKW